MGSYIFELSVIVFFSQLFFIGFRTLNVKAVATKNIKGALITGAFVHLSWLVSVSVGATSTYEIVAQQQWQYWPVIACSLSGGLIGTFVAMKYKHNA